MHEHDGYAPHSHEVRADHREVPRQAPPHAAGFCADCGLPIWWQDERLVSRGEQRWCFGPDRSRVTMERWHHLPGMAQYVVQAANDSVCHCLSRSGPHIHQIVDVPERVASPGVTSDDVYAAGCEIGSILGQNDYRVPPDVIKRVVAVMQALERKASGG